MRQLSNFMLHKSEVSKDRLKGKAIMRKRMLSVLLAIWLFWTMTPLAVMAETANRSGEENREMIIPPAEPAETETVLPPEKPVQDEAGAGAEEKSLMQATAGATVTGTIWIGQVQVTDENKDGITGDGIEGTVIYDPVTNTLTLRDAHITTASECIFDSPLGLKGPAGIYAGGDLNILLEGENSIDLSDFSAGVLSNASAGILVQKGTLQIEGTGSLNVTASRLQYSLNSKSAGIYVKERGNLAIFAKVTATGGRGGEHSHGIYGKSSNITIAGSLAEVRVTGAGGGINCGVFVEHYNDYEIKSCTVKEGGRLYATGGKGSGASAGVRLNSAFSSIIVDGGSLIASGGKGSTSYGLYSGSLNVEEGSTVIASCEQANPLFGAISLQRSKSLNVDSKVGIWGRSSSAPESTDLSEITVDDIYEASKSMSTVHIYLKFEPATAPGAPTGLTATGGDKQITLSWIAPELTGGSPITGYEYSINYNPWVTMENLEGLTYTLTGLTNGNTYTVRVRAVNAVGKGAEASVQATLPIMNHLITYHPNGSIDAPVSGIAVEGEPYTLLNNSFSAPPGYRFKAWAMGSVSGPQMQPGEDYIFYGDTTLYAVWEELKVVGPDDLIYDLTPVDYDGTEKPVAVTAQPGKNLGAITVRYWCDDALRPKGFQPVNAGTYVVYAEIDPSEEYYDVPWLELGEFIIRKIDYQGPKTIETSLPASGKNGVTVSLPALPEGAAYGTPVAGSPIAMTGMSITGQTLTFNAPPATAGQTSTITVPVTGSGNYHDYNIVVTVTYSSGGGSGDHPGGSGDDPGSNDPVEAPGGGSDNSGGGGSGDGPGGNVGDDPGSDDGDDDEGSNNSGSGGKGTGDNSLVNTGTQPAGENQASPNGDGYRDEASSFTDIAGHWAKDHIDYVVSQGLFNGTSETSFSPNTEMTRGMFVTVLGRLAGAQVSDYRESSFTDVAEGAYYLGYIEWARSNNLVNGMGNGIFAPDRPVTREEAAVMLLNYAKFSGWRLPEADEAGTFADSDKISLYAREAVEELYRGGVLNGKNGNLFDPQGTVTRAEVAAMLHRFLRLAVSGDIM